MIDCFVSLFRIIPHNNEALKVCLNPNSQSTYHFVLVSSLYRWDFFLLSFLSYYWKKGRGMRRPGAYYGKIIYQMSVYFLSASNIWAENPFLQIHCILVLDSGPALPYRIITQPRLPWWPQIDIVYNKSSELRSMFTDTLNKVTQGCISHTPLRMIQVSSWPYFFLFLYFYMYLLYIWM